MKRGGFLKEADRDALAKFPNQVDRDDLRRCFTLTSHDFAEVVDRRYTDGSRVAAGVQIGALRLLGFVPDDVSAIPDAALAVVAEQVRASPGAISDYTTRQQTRSGHVTAVIQHLGFRRADQGDLKVLGDWLTERALEHDRPIVLFHLACEFLKAEYVGAYTERCQRAG